MTDAVDVESVDDSVAQLRRVPAGVYHVRREVARGGMGIILEAWDARHGRAVAIKTLRHGSPVRASRFLREVRVTSELQHPSIIPLYEAGLWPSGDPYYAMRLVEGHSLAKAAELATTARERLALLPHLIALAEALAYAHERGIIHRDLKPANVLVGKFGETVVIDWGLAKRVDEAEPPPLDALPETGAGLTLDGEVLGTLAFMAPEQARGEAVDARADVYALGALAYHVLAGVGPYAGVTSVEPVLDGPPIAIDEIAPELPAELRAIVAKAMAREPGDRYPSAKELAADLKAFATGRLVSAMSYSRWMLLRRWVTRHRGPVAVAAVSSRCWRSPSPCR
jgi:serine/threonine protein kinase